ncbi:MAG: flagellar motor switch protein FliM [Candidatus Midichloria sp.]|uniref:Flagellar motor switch protein FliM n=1 Tax=Hyalomma marginatum TaxID=34627 RepID=A0A8S4C1E7_9ACAR|nr:flagellar motor switch protein FliM [Hyalomma marginatum]CAG7591747.1 flagellar motor switch protein FliM [Hyalomma marginatum]
MKKQQDDNLKDNASKTGISALIDQRSRALLKFPMLDVIYDKFIEVITLPFREALNAEVLLETESIKSLKFSDYVQNEKSGSIFCIGKANKLSGYFMLNLSPDIVFLFLSILLGGNKKKPEGIKSDIRPFTAIEMEIIKYMLNIIFKNFNYAFSTVIPFHSEIERIEIDKNTIKIAKNEEAVGRIRTNLKINSAWGYFDIVFPYNSLESVKKVLSQSFLEDKIFQDPIWFDHFEKEIKNTKVKLELILDGAASKISELLNLKVGNTVVLDKFAEEPLYVSINGVKVTMGKLGKAGDKVAVQLLDDINIAKFNHIL